jgi:ABC-type proline/glycine betaine transport system ATPase subunit
MTALENAAFGLKIRKVKKSERLEVAKKYLRLVGLEGFENYYPSQVVWRHAAESRYCACVCNRP